MRVLLIWIFFSSPSYSILPSSEGICSKCIQRGEIYCPMFDRCGILPFCLKWIDKILNCPDSRNISVQYDEQFARNKMMPLAAAAYSDDPVPCAKKALPSFRLISTYSVRCSYETDSLIHITTSWIAYFLDRINWIEYNPPPIFSSDCFAFIGIDDVAKVIVMGFRGTEGIFQLMEQLLQYHRGRKPFYDNGSIYEYFYNAFHLLWTGGFEKGAREVLELASEDYELWITGLSLGGALASVTSSYIAKLQLFPLPEQNSSLSDSHVSPITIMPRGTMQHFPIRLESSTEEIQSLIFPENRSIGPISSWDRDMVSNGNVAIIQL